MIILTSFTLVLFTIDWFLLHLLELEVFIEVINKSFSSFVILLNLLNRIIDINSWRKSEFTIKLTRKMSIICIKDMVRQTVKISSILSGSLWNRAENRLPMRNGSRIIRLRILMVIALMANCRSTTVTLLRRLAFNRDVTIW